MIKKNAGLIFFVLWLVSCASVSAQQPVGLDGIGDTYYPQWGNSGYDALHYLLDLSVNVNSNFISGTTVMRAQATQPLTSFNLDFRGLTIDDVMVNDKPAQYNRAGHELTIIPAGLLAAGQTFTVTVQYKGTPEPFVAETDQQYPILIGWMHSANNIFVLNEPIGAESWYPVNNHPLDKATYTFHITVPKPYVVAANGLLLTTEDHGNSLTYIWESKYPTASYLTMLDIGEFTVETKTGPNGLPIRNYLIPGRADELSDNLKLTGEMIRFFNEAFGPYPFEAYGAVVIDKNVEGFTGLETQTLSMLLQEGTIPQEVIAHELAHQWFGDSVSLKDWQDVWLKEGFANYAEWLWLEHNEGRKVVDQKVRDLWLERSFEDTPPGTPPADNLYHGSVYVRGAMTLHALRLRLGDETFFRILHTYTDRYRYSNASTADFIAVAEEVSGQTLTQFFNDWLYTKHLPDIPEIGLTQ